MEFFLFIFLYALLTWINTFKSSHEPFYESNANNIYIILVFITLFFVGLNGNEDEYTRVFLRSPEIQDLFFPNYLTSQTGNVFNIFIEKGPIFIFYNSLIKSIGLTSQFIHLTYATISLVLISVFYKKYTRYYMLAFLIYLSHYIMFRELSGIRVALTSAAVLLMIYFIVNNQKFRFYLLIIFCFFNHYISIIALILIFLKKQINYKFIIIGLVIATFFYYINAPKLLFNILGELDNNESIISLYAKSNYSVTMSFFNGKNIQQILLIFLLMYFNKSENLNTEERKYFHIIFNTYCISTMLLITFSNYSIFANRFNGFFSILEPICVTYLIINVMLKKTFISIIIGMILLISFFNYIYFNRIGSYNFLLDWDSPNIKHLEWQIDRQNANGFR